MNHGFVTKKVAIRLKELGYDKEVFAYYTSHSGDEPARPQIEPRGWNFNGPTLLIDAHMDGYEKWSAPTWTEAAKWLFENYGVIGALYYSGYGGSKSGAAVTFEESLLEAMEGLTR